MSRTLTAADRSRLIRLASTMPVGSAERRAILAGLSKSAAHPFPDGVLTKAEYSRLPDPRDWKGYTFYGYYQWDYETDDPEKGYSIKPRHVDWLGQVPDAVHSSRLSDTDLDDSRISKNLKWTPHVFGRELWLESVHPDDRMMTYRVSVQRNDRQRLSRVEVDYLTKAFR